jgi:hypothetical protein
MPENNGSPLSEADPRSLDEIFSSRPPFDPGALRRQIEEFRRMRVKWQSDEAEGKSKRVAKKVKAGTASVPVGDLFGEEGGEK